MITAILYTSNSGYTRQYAELLAKATHLPAYDIHNSIPPALLGTDVIYLGWLMAGSVKGFKETRAKYQIRALCAVGMSPAETDQTSGIKKLYGLSDLPVFYLQGGFDIHKLSGIYKLMMRVMSKKIRGDFEKQPTRTPEQESLYQMATVGANYVSAEQLSGVEAWYASEQAAQ